MKNLIRQLIKFGIVGVISFLIDFAVYTIVANVLNWHYLIAGFLGFFISVIVNYILSMRFVFVAKKGMPVKKQFTIFLILSILGLILNEIILFICISVIYANTPVLHNFIGTKLINIIAKIIATGIVMVFNFVTRKVFLEEKGSVSG